MVATMSSRGREEKRVQATARVRLIVDIPVSDTWGDTTDIAQVHRQAKRSAEQTVRGIIEIVEYRAGAHYQNPDRTKNDGHGFATCHECGKRWPCDDALKHRIVRRETELGVLIAHGKVRIVDEQVTIIFVEEDRS